jgi:hypothetical protein
MKRFAILTALTLLLAGLLAGGLPARAQDAPPPPANEGAYDALSSGNQKVVSAIYESHLEATASDPNAMTLTKDDIAAMKADGGWGNTYKQLYANGQVTHRNLGQAISSYNHSVKAASTGSPTVVTTGNGQQIVGGGKKGGAAGASAKADGPGGGKKSGHQKTTVVTSGAGGVAAAGSASHSSAGGASGLAGAGGAKGRGQGGASHKGK